MLSKNFKPKAIHKRFHDNLFKLGCIVTGSFPQLHHIVGSSYRQDGVWIGQWYLIPLSPDLHMDGNVNVTSNKVEFYEKVGSEKNLFINTLSNYIIEYGEMPLPAKELFAILSCKEGDMFMTDDNWLALDESLDWFKEELSFTLDNEEVANETKKAIDSYRSRQTNRLW